MFGLALDIGTTTCVGSILDLKNKKEILRYSTWNKQRIYGEDVITRLKYGLNENGLKNLNKKIIETINEIIDKLVNQAHIRKDEIEKVVISGNTIMQHFLLCASVKKLATYPFIPTITPHHGIITDTHKLNINLKKVNVYIIPIVSAFIGGDVISLILKADLNNTQHLKIGIDLGTNGEIVFAKRDEIIATSCACGGAFEGYNLSCGMVAKEGAIEKCKIQNAKCKITYKVIGDIEPQGLCGSAIFDLIYYLLKYNVITHSGKFKNNTDRFYVDKKYNIYLTQTDIRNFQLAKAAISSSISLLKNNLKINNQQIKKILISGAFGYHLSKDGIKKVKLIPNIPNNKIEFLGNTSLEGAKLVLLDEKKYEEAVNIAKKVKCINLAEKKEFQDYFIKAINF